MPSDLATIAYLPGSRDPSTGFCTIHASPTFDILFAGTRSYLSVEAHLMRLRVPVDVVGDQCLDKNANFDSGAADRGTSCSVPVRVQSGNRTIGLLGLIVVGTLLACTVYFVVEYLW